MSARLQATLIAEPRPWLLLWVPPRGETTLEEELAALFGGKSVTSAASAWLALPAAWAPRGRSGRTLRVARVNGWRAEIGAFAELLVRLNLDDSKHRSRSLAAWAVAAKLAVELVARHRVLPWLDQEEGGGVARWRVALDGDDRRRLAALARALPPAARAWSGADSPRSPARLLTGAAAARRFLDSIADSLLRAAPVRRRATGGDWAGRTAVALAADDGRLPLRGLLDERLPEELRAWAGPGTGEEDGRSVRLALRLETPHGDDEPWPVLFLAQAADDPSLLVEAAEVWRLDPRQARLFGRQVEAPQVALLRCLGQAARLWPRLGACLQARRPEGMELATQEVPAFLAETVPLLRSSGVEVLVPQELTAAGRRRLRARLRSRSTTTAPAGEAAGFSFDSMVDVQWEVALGDQPMSLTELRSLAALKRPLVRWRDQWVMLDPEQLAELAKLAQKGSWQLEATELLRRALSSGPEDEAALHLEPGSQLAEAIARLRSEPREELGDVVGLNGSLRPYQRVGVAWLDHLARAGLGACLADDMGLGKTVQVITFLLRRAASRPDRPHLLVCPTSVLGNWERELSRFAPRLEVFRHYGAERAASRRALARGARPGTIVLTSYGVLRLDESLLGARDWDVVVLDEAQVIKNPHAKVARAACSLPSRLRLALTGTPVENRLTDLWSIFRFVNPGLLGSLSSFQRELAVPVERYRNQAAVDRLQRLTSPFVLRRTKDDPTILPDLPPKVVLRSVCPLTPEQASLYRAAVDAAMEEIQTSEGMDRRGRVLALITALKQICNHPDHYLRSRGRLDGRSGKLDRLGDELEEVLSEGEAALVFTQYREMGELLLAYLRERLAVQPPFLHGGVPRDARERMVAAFQAADGPPVMVVSLKAGGTGLNLTRASHVFHFDRWWNPAVENQASDRAHRIGQTRTVFVHTLGSRGTLEERVERLLAEKAELARLALRSGEGFLTELDDEALGELVRLDETLAEES